MPRHSGKDAARFESELDRQNAKKGKLRMISIEDFAKMDLRVGTVVTAEPIQGASKLLKLEIDIGDKKLITTSGIAQYYKPEEMLGRKVVVVANLQPAIIRGIESQTMILAASAEGRLALVTVSEDVPNGTRIK
ncbi:MAG: methionine--tRNA ligase subunit beta [Chloroflexota bacterium]